MEHEGNNYTNCDWCKLHWDFEIQTEHLISARWSDHIIINKKKKKKRKKEKKRTCKIVDFAIPAVPRIKTEENEKKDKNLDLVREVKKLALESDVYTNCNCCSWYSHQRVNKSNLGTWK